MPPEFRPIPKHEEFYGINEEGLIYSTRKKMIVNPTLDGCGYLQIRLSKNKKKKKYSVARINCTVWHGPPPHRNSQVNHKNLDKLDNHKDNLEWSLPCTNSQHRVLNGGGKRETYSEAKARFHSAKTPQN